MKSKKSGSDDLVSTGILMKYLISYFEYTTISTKEVINMLPIFKTFLDHIILCNGLFSDDRFGKYVSLVDTYIGQLTVSSLVQVMACPTTWTSDNVLSI